MRLKVWARRASSSPPLTSSRSWSSRSGWAAIVSVWRVKRAIGASAVRATSNPSSPASRIPPAAIRASSSSWLSSVWSTSLSGSATSSAPRQPIPVASTRMSVPLTFMSVKYWPLPRAASARARASTGMLWLWPRGTKVVPSRLTSVSAPAAPPNGRAAPVTQTQALVGVSGVADVEDATTAVAARRRRSPGACPGRRADRRRRVTMLAVRLRSELSSWPLSSERVPA